MVYGDESFARWEHTQDISYIPDDVLARWEYEGELALLQDLDLRQDDIMRAAQ